MIAVKIILLGQDRNFYFTPISRYNPKYRKFALSKYNMIGFY